MCNLQGFHQVSLLSPPPHRSGRRYCCILTFGNGAIYLDARVNNRNICAYVYGMFYLVGLYLNAWLPFGGCATLTLEFAQEKKTSCRSVVKGQIVILYKCYIVGTFQKGSSFFISVIQEPPKSINSSPIFLWKPLTLQLWRSVRHVTLQFLKQQSAFGGSVLRSRGRGNCVPNLWIKLRHGPMWEVSFGIHVLG